MLSISPIVIFLNCVKKFPKNYWSFLDFGLEKRVPVNSPIIAHAENYAIATTGLTPELLRTNTILQYCK